MSYTNGLDKPTDYFRTKLYNGNNNPQNITWDETDVNMKPDFLWIKSRAGTTVFDHVAGNVVSGSGKYLKPNTTDAEVSNSNVINTFNTNGFSVGGATFVSEGGRTYVAWGWKGAGSTSSNTDGSITSTVSANTTSGFSIVSYTGTGSASDSVGHGLSKTPGMIFVKRRDSAGDWRVWHQNLSATTGKNLRLNTNDAEDSNISFFYSQPPNATTFRPGSGGNTNSSSATYIAYCFEEKKGFSKFGSFISNGSSDGTFIYTGFKPAFVIIKRTNDTGNWSMWDNKRNTFNVMDKYLLANSNGAEGTDAQLDLLSNGIKIRNSGYPSGSNWIYMAFAESPFVTSTGIPTVAR